MNSIKSLSVIVSFSGSGLASVSVWSLKYKHAITPATPRSVFESRLSLKTSRINEECVEDKSSELRMCSKLVRVPINSSRDVPDEVPSVSKILLLRMVTVDFKLLQNRGWWYLCWCWLLFASVEQPHCLWKYLVGYLPWWFHTVPPFGKSCWIFLPEFY